MRLMASLAVMLEDILRSLSSSLACGTTGWRPGEALKQCKQPGGRVHGGRWRASCLRPALALLGVHFLLLGLHIRRRLVHDALKHAVSHAAGCLLAGPWQAWRLQRRPPPPLGNRGCESFLAGVPTLLKRKQGVGSGRNAGFCREAPGDAGPSRGVSPDLLNDCVHGLVIMRDLRGPFQPMYSVIGSTRRETSHGSSGTLPTVNSPPPRAPECILARKLLCSPALGALQPREAQPARLSYSLQPRRSSARSDSTEAVAREV